MILMIFEPRGRDSWAMRSGKKLVASIKRDRTNKCRLRATDGHVFNREELAGALVFIEERQKDVPLARSTKRKRAA
jgi:hypothetical protein